MYIFTIIYLLRVSLSYLLCICSLSYICSGYLYLICYVYVHYHIYFQGISILSAMYIFTIIYLLRISLSPEGPGIVSYMLCIFSRCSGYDGYVLSPKQVLNSSSRRTSGVGKDHPHLRANAPRTSSEEDVPENHAGGLPRGPGVGALAADRDPAAGRGGPYGDLTITSPTIISERNKKKKKELDLF